MKVLYHAAAAISWSEVMLLGGGSAVSYPQVGGQFDLDLDLLVQR